MGRRIRNSTIPVSERRLVRDKEGADFYGLGVTTFRRWAERIGAVRKIGNCWTADREILDRDLDRGRMDECTERTDGHSDY